MKYVYKVSKHNSPLMNRKQEEKKCIIDTASLLESCKMVNIIKRYPLPNS